MAAHQRAAGAWTRARSWPRCATCARWRSARSDGRPTRGSSTACSRSTTILGYQQPVGAHLKYLVWGAGRPRCVAGRPRGTSARAIGSSGGRPTPGAANLRFLAYNTRFLILPWVAVPHLASHVLGRMAALVPAEWQQLYGHPLYFLETFIDPARFAARAIARRTGACSAAPRGAATTRRPCGPTRPVKRCSAIPREGLSRSLDEDDALSRPRRKKAGPAGASAHRAAVRRAGRDRRAHQGGVEPGRPREAQGRADTLAFVTAELQTTQTSLDRLRRLSSARRPRRRARSSAGRGARRAGTGQPACRGRPVRGRPPAPGHGRTGAAAYTGADTVTIAHPSLRRGDRCPGCTTGKIYPLAEPATLVRITGMAPLGATVYACERWRCNLCGEVFTARRPQAWATRSTTRRPRRWSACSSTAVASRSIASRPCSGLRIPLPAATQWELVRDALPQLVPAWDELLRQAAQGEVVYNDDTTMKVLALTAEQRRAAAADEETDARTGVFTSGIVATRDGHRIALFFTGRQHAGENLADVLAQRAARPPPIQMCDALATNTAGAFDTLLASCLAHARRRFVDVVDTFPAEVRHVLEHPASTEPMPSRALSPDERLRLHQPRAGR